MRWLQYIHTVSWICLNQVYVYKLQILICAIFRLAHNFRFNKNLAIVLKAFVLVARSRVVNARDA